MIILIGGEKGGTGKSTIATNLAAYLAQRGKDVLLLDADRQGTAANWATERGEHENLPPVHCVQRYGNLLKTLQDVRDRYAYVLVDAGGRDSEELRSAMVAAHKLYSPFKASQSDLWTVEHVDKLVGMARAMNPELEAYALLSMAPTNPRINETAEAKEMLAECSELKFVDHAIRDRKAFRDAMCEGRGVVEYDDSKAKDEIVALAKEVFSGQV